MRILKLTCQFMPEVYGGAEKQCLRQARILTEKGHQVVILTSRQRLSSPACEVIDGIKIRRIYTICQPDLLGRWLPFSLLWLLQTMLYALRHRKEFDLVHCHQGKFGLYVGSVMAKILRVPQVVKIGNSGLALDVRALKRKRFVGSFFLKKSLEGSPTFVAISAKIEKELVQFGIPKQYIHKITNGVISLEANFKAPNAKALQFFWHGRFEPIKNLTLLVEAFSAALKERATIELNLVGAGTEQAMLEAMVKERGIQDKVRFIEPPEHLFDQISNFDIFINTSLYEGMSNAMLEAMALGKFIVSTPVSGTDEIIDDQNGIVVESYAIADVASAILKAAAYVPEHAHEIYDYNRAKVKEQFEMHQIVDQYDDLYRKLTDGT